MSTQTAQVIDQKTAMKLSHRNETSTLKAAIFSDKGTLSKPYF